jgi:hypothetical protein
MHILSNGGTNMFHRIKSVAPLPDMLLRVEFLGGHIKRYDVKPLVSKWDVFADLKRTELFNLVYVDTGGYGVVWNEYVDLACDELWDNGVAVSETD